MYINKALDILLEDSKIYTTRATSGKGGILYLANTASNPLTSVTLTRVTASDVYSTLSGSMIYSEASTPTITLTDNVLQCKPVTYTSVAMGPPQIGGAFYIKDAVSVSSTNNNIKYCYNSDIGGAFHIENSRLIDISSEIRDNTAVYGGAISCKSCTLLSLTSTELYHHSAYTTAMNVGGLGGVIYLVDPGTVYLNHITVQDGYAMNKGGFVYAEGTAASPVSLFTIDNTIDTTPLTLEQFKSEFNGGGIYVNHPKFSITMTKPIALKNSKALNGYGGFFYFHEVSQVTLASSIYEDISSTAFGSFLYSVATGLQLTVTGSQVNCAGTP
jgi:predicted outer membrane repeat protein